MPLSVLPAVLAAVVQRPTIKHIMDVLEKLSILTDAAKYDAACTSSGGSRSFKKGHIGNTSSSVAGCCHSFSADGRCVTLLKVLMTNRCMNNMPKRYWNTMTEFQDESYFKAESFPADAAGHAVPAGKPVPEILPGCELSDPG